MEQALALLLDRDLTKIDYQEITEVVNMNGKVLPLYHDIEAAKRDCRPSNILYSMDDIQVSFQDICHHTTSRILKDSEIASSVMDLWNKKKDTFQLFLSVKYGMDGSRGMSMSLVRMSTKPFTFQPKTTN